MIPALLLWLIRKYGNPFHRSMPAGAPIGIWIHYPLRLLLLVMLALLLYLKADAQQILRFRVLVKNDPVGFVTVEHTVNGKLDQVKVRSSLDFRLLFRYHMDIREEISTLDNMLHYSLLLRKKNGEETINRLKQQNGNRLEILENGKVRYQEIPGVPFHVLQLYFREPEGIRQVYSEKFEQQVPVKQSGPHIYELSLPDGNTNTYYYSNGACTKIRLNSTFFSASIIKE